MLRASCNPGPDLKCPPTLQLPQPQPVGPPPPANPLPESGPHANKKFVLILLQLLCPPKSFYSLENFWSGKKIGKIKEKKSRAKKER
jgi:hypothetical protein